MPTASGASEEGEDHLLSASRGPGSTLGVASHRLMPHPGGLLSVNYCTITTEAE